MENKILTLLLALIIVLPLASAATKDVAYVLKDSNQPEQGVIQAITGLGYTYDLIDDSQILSTNFSNYRIMVIGDGNFRNYLSNLKVNNKPALIMNTYHTDDWAWTIDGVAQTASSQPLTAKVVNTNTSITKNIPTNFQVYTQARSNGASIPLYYLSRSKRATKITNAVAPNTHDLGSAVGFVRRGTTLKNGVVSNSRGIFFGAMETDYWTENTKTLFKNSLKWLVEDEDRDNDGFKSDVDCNDNDRTINPSAPEIPYDGVDQNCDGKDLRDVDRDGYEAEVVGGTDCNDNDASVHPGATDRRKDCINEPPVFNGPISTIEWNEDSSALVNLKTYFSDPDADKLNFSIHESSPNENVLLAFSETGILTVSSIENWNGEDWVIIKGQDPKGLFVLSNNVTLKANPINDNPLIELINNIFSVEGNLIEVIVNATDPDGDSLIYSINSNKFTQNGNVFRWQTAVGDSGDYSFIVNTEDGNGGSDSQEIQVGVFKKILINEFVSNPSQGNEAVEIYNPGDKSFSLETCVIKDGSNHELKLNGAVLAKKFSVFGYNSSVLNNDGDIISLYCHNQLIDKVSYGSWDDGDILDNAPAPGQGKSAGRDPDGKDTDNDKNDFRVFDIPTIGLPSNADLIPPVVTLLNPANSTLFNETRDVNFEFKAADNSADRLSCDLYLNGKAEATKVVDNGANSNFMANGIADGSYRWNVKCNDGFTSAFAGSERSFQISAPDIPIIEEISNKVVDEGKILEFAVRGFDNDGDSISFSIEEKPEGANFTDRHDGTAVFSWTPDFDQAGNYTVKFNVEDSSGLKSSRNAGIVVNDVKAPPTFKDAKQCKTKSSEIEIDIKNPDKGDEFKIGEKIDAEVNIENNFQEDLDFDVEVHLYDLEEDESVDDKDDSVNINDGDDKTLEFELEVPSDIEGDEFAFYVYAEDEEGRCNSDFVEIDIEREDDNVVVDSVEITPTIVYSGDSIEVNVNLKNLGSDDQDVYVKVESTELGISAESEEFEIEKFDEDDEESQVFILKVPESASEKEYSIKATVFFSGEENSNSASFLVTKKPVTKITLPEGVEKGELIKLDDRDFEETARKTTVTEKREITKKSQVNINVSGLATNDLLIIIDIILIIGILIEIVMIRVVTARRRF